jgi:hypothetical protein
MDEAFPMGTFAKQLDDADQLACTRIIKKALSEEHDDETSSWRIDRNINVSIIGALLFSVIASIASGSFFIATLSTRIANDETSAHEQAESVKALIGTQTDVGTRLTRVETQVEQVLDILRRIDGRGGLSK